VLGVSIGAFGDRFAKIAEAYGANVDRVAAEWGWAAAPDEVRERLAMGDYKAVLLTHNETSTGVMNPIPELVDAIKAEAPDTLILVDTVSSLGAVPFDMDGWGIDVVATASQKAWMAAPGLAMVAASERAREAMKAARMPRFYLDLQKHLDAMASGETPWTPAVAVAFQVDEGIRLMNEEGQAGVFARHVACAAATQAGLQALGFELFAEPTHRSKTVTAASIPDGLDWKAFNGEIKRRELVLAGGQGKLTGKVFRVGHLGSVTVGEILDAIDTIEQVSIEWGREVEAGAAVAAAERAAAGAALQPA
jgi:aspartate aminotransferase-like enzyme